MTKGNHSNAYDVHKSVGAQGAVRRALVVNVMDPQKAGRVQIREVGHMDDEQAMPDDKLPWVKIQGSTSFAGMHSATGTHGLMPGSMVYVNGYGENGQDIVITGTIANDQKGGDAQAIHPATQGKGDTDSVATNQNYKQGKHFWHKNLRQIMESKTTREARETRDSAKGVQNRTDRYAVDHGINQARVPDHYGGRKAAKDPNGGTIGTSAYDNGGNAQKFIQDTIQNKSAIIPNALQAMEQLKKVKGNPNSVQSIGAQNFSAIMQQLGQLRQQKQEYDCEYLLTIPDEELSEELLARKRQCELLQENLNEEENANV